MSDMAEGPKALVGKPVIVTLFFFFGKPDPFKNIFGIFGWDPDFVLTIDHIPVGIAGPLSNPHSSTGLEHRLQGGHQTAGRHQIFDFFPFFDMAVWLPVGNHEKGPFLQEGTHLLFQPGRGPEGFSGMPQSGLFFRRCPGRGNTPGHVSNLTGQGFKYPPRWKLKRAYIFFGPQALDPLGHSGNRAGHTPANQEKSG